MQSRNERWCAMGLTFEQGRFEDARFVRTRVFMIEQGFKNEFDEIDDDPTTVHLTLYRDGRHVGCARTFPESGTLPMIRDARVFGRLAVLPESAQERPRRRALSGVGACGARSRRDRDASAASQSVSVTGLYERAGYERYGAEELGRARILTYWMQKPL